jgi:hexosaminidase
VSAAATNLPVPGNRPGGLPLVPWPAEVELLDGPAPSLAVVRVDAPDAGVAALAAEELTAAGVRVASDAPVGVTLRLDPASGPAGSDGAERYTLRVSGDGVVATAPEPAGLAHALRTLRQLAAAAGEDAAGVPAVVVHDAPRYAWRGLSVDVVRHWFGPEDLRAVVDLVAALKLRVLHLHLTDDQGWRLEIPSRPGLVERSAGTQVGGGAGGHLTLEDYRELQEYAARRFVTVVPEVDLPGHVNAATHAYGELMPDGEPTDVYTGTEVGFSRLWFGNPATEPFLRDVLTDVARATTGPYVHVGGDEVLTMEPDEYARFVELACRIVREAGKTPVLWQEGARGPLSPGTLLQFWDPRADAGPFVAAAGAGARFVMSPGPHAYLDMKYTPEHPLGLEWAGHVELRDAYSWDPEQVVPGLPAEAVEGVAAAIWTETLEARDELFSMLLPRLAAVAEVAWSAPDAKDWEAFRARVAAQAPAWRAAAWAFHPTPQADWLAGGCAAGQIQERRSMRARQ